MHQRPHKALSVDICQAGWGKSLDALLDFRNSSVKSFSFAAAFARTVIRGQYINAELALFSSLDVA